MGDRFEDTAIGGGGGLPTTRASVLTRLRSADSDERRRGFEVLVAAYWKPVYKHVRLGWRRSNEDAKDLTQAFFLRAMEKSFFGSYDPAQARFRTFLRTCLDGFVANEDKAARAQKRGGEAVLLSLDFAGAEQEIAGVVAPSHLEPDRAFQAEWLRSLFALAIAGLRAEASARGREVSFRLFERYDLGVQSERPTYEQLAAEVGMPVTSITNHLAWARRELRKSLLRTLREITASEAEYRAEAREILGEEVD